MFADIPGADLLLDKYVGIPGAATTRKAQLTILNGLVNAFMTEYIKATITGTGGAVLIMANSSASEEADIYAAKYTRSREKHLEEFDNRVQAEMDKKNK
jgi:hypothetical protein